MNKNEELEMETDSLYLALSGKDSYDCSREEYRVEREFLEQKIAKMVSQLMEQPTSS